MIKKQLIIGLMLILVVGCSKKTEDVAPALVNVRLEIAPASQSTTIGGTAIFTLKYFNEMEKLVQTPANVVWESANINIATINQNGVATGVSAGQVQIRAKIANNEALALLTVVSNNTQVATISITPLVQELVLNATVTPAAIAKNNEGAALAGKTFAWQSNNTTIAEVNANTGVVIAKGYGTTTITATADGIQSEPTQIQVIRTSAFSGRSQGSAKLKIENGILKLQTSADFGGSNAPDLRMYLSNSSGNVSDAIEIATLTQRSGAQSWNLPIGTNITQYRYVLVWCKQFSANYGTVDLGQ
ncbi:MAG: hypothetical protein EAZ08_05345 [Cytophagales bacterium]|nr:MAG: hypothetical protein EAZ08_05345 [Cytophagales bacterium]